MAQKAAGLQTSFLLGPAKPEGGWSACKVPRGLPKAAGLPARCLGGSQKACGLQTSFLMDQKRPNLRAAGLPARCFGAPIRRLVCRPAAFPKGVWSTDQLPFGQGVQSPRLLQLPSGLIVQSPRPLHLPSGGCFGPSQLLQQLPLGFGTMAGRGAPEPGGLGRTGGLEGIQQNFP